jgi:hypothetical protein
MLNKEYFKKRKEELKNDAFELRNKYANKFVILHDELNIEEKNLQNKWKAIDLQEKQSLEESKKELIPEVKEIVEEQKN